jgi:sorbitol/mannitol transport system permease protein
MTSPYRKIALTAAGWLVSLAFFFPIFWMALTAFKTELAAFSAPTLFFEPTLDNFRIVFEQTDYLRYAWNSVAMSFGSTLLALLLGLPAAYAMSFFPTSRTRFTLLWMLSTKMLPAVGVLVPVYLIYRNLGLLDSVFGLLLILAFINLPIVVWMLYTFFNDVPGEILDATRVDGAGHLTGIRYVLLPISLPGIASTCLLAVILAWNEAFWSLNLTGARAAPLTAFVTFYTSPQGLFWATLSAASLMAVAPILAVGWASQRQLVRGLTFGAVK